MKTYDNTMGITTTVVDYPVTSYCIIGNDYYTGELHVEITMGSQYIDLDIVRTFFEKDLNGARVTAEELVGLVFEKIKTLYVPKAVKIEFSFSSPLPTKLVKTWESE